MTTLTPQERNTIIAALRELQTVIQESGDVPQDMADQFSQMPCLSADRIDDLIQRLCH